MGVVRSAAKEAPYYFVPASSRHPVMASIGLLVTMAGAAMWVNGYAAGPWLVLAGLLHFIFVLYGWFGDAIGESQGGLYSKRIDTSFRWSMGWFIFSEVMFFSAFFGALLYARYVGLGDLSEETARWVLWPDFAPSWPHGGPAGTVEPFVPMTPFWIPTINTALLLASGVTLTISHHALRAGHRSKSAFWLLSTVILGAIFMGFQVWEYVHAYRELGLKMTSGIYGSTFFMLTGFHGFHVTMGAIMLAVVWVRMVKGHFTPEQHFAFEGAAWYWHFVDVVWLGLYVLVYWM